MYPLNKPCLYFMLPFRVHDCFFIVIRGYAGGRRGNAWEEMRLLVGVDVNVRPFTTLTFNSALKIMQFLFLYGCGNACGGEWYCVDCL